MPVAAQLRVNIFAASRSCCWDTGSQYFSLVPGCRRCLGLQPAGMPGSRCPGPMLLGWTLFLRPVMRRWRASRAPPTVPGVPLPVGAGQRSSSWGSRTPRSLPAAEESPLGSTQGDHGHSPQAGQNHLLHVALGFSSWNTDAGAEYYERVCQRALHTRVSDNSAQLPISDVGRPLDAQGVVLTQQSYAN